MKKAKKGFMFIELLLVLAVVMYAVFKVLNFYFKKPPLDKDTQRVMSEQGVDATSYKSIIDTTSNKLKDIQSRQVDELSKIK